MLGNNGQIQLSEELRRMDMVASHAAYVDAIKQRDFFMTRELVDSHLFGLCSKYHIAVRHLVNRCYTASQLRARVGNPHLCIDMQHTNDL
jgi:hypothetical protein